MSDEQTEASGVAGILTTMETEAGQLAGDDNALKDPGKRSRCGNSSKIEIL